MRISDWSSDVCSSDLPPRIVVGRDAAFGDIDRTPDPFVREADRACERLGIIFIARRGQLCPLLERQGTVRSDADPRVGLHADEVGCLGDLDPWAIPR